jgi:hypothetical protein
MEGVFATSHVDRHHEKITVEALRSFAAMTNSTYIPVLIEHDPRVPPQGRVISAELRQLEDGEYAVVGISEIFEEGDVIPFKNDGREIPICEFSENRIHIMYDRSYINREDIKEIENLKNLLNAEAEEEGKKALEPISVLGLGAAFILGGISSGFLNKVGEDGYELLKNKIKNLLNRKRLNKQEYLFRLETNIEREDGILNIVTIITNPTNEDIDSLLSSGLKQLDQLTERLGPETTNIKKIVCEFRAGELREPFGIRKDAVPVKLQLK